MWFEKKSPKVMNNVELLDCTLRDGGYVNDWAFGHSVITGTYKKLDQSGVDYIEVGFLDDRRRENSDYTIQPLTASFDRLLGNIKKRNATPVAMIDFGTCDINNIAPAEESFLDGIRVIFKKEKIDQALPFCREIKEKGYKLFIQAISITAYSDEEIVGYVKKINEIKPYCFSIVDTYGLLDKARLLRYFELIDSNMDQSIKMGYHSHNNFQLAFSNTMEFLARQTRRPLIVDSTIYGMGKSAGNCPSELISVHLNQYYGKNYDVNQFLEALDADLMPIYQKHYWGYKYNFFISAMQNCHPNYVQYLLDKKTLTISAVNKILSSINSQKKLLYDARYIEELYTKYQSAQIDDDDSISRLSEELHDKPVLLLGLGKHLIDYKSNIDDLVDRKKPIIFSVNHLSNFFVSDYVFVSNSKRYGRLVDDVAELPSNSRLIITSNLEPFDIKPSFVLNYGLLTKVFDIKTDNSLLLLLSALHSMGKNEIYLAGFDGYSGNDTAYIDRSYHFAGNEKYQLDTNELILQELARIKSVMNVVFVTPSLYEQ